MENFAANSLTSSSPFVRPSRLEMTDYSGSFHGTSQNNSFPGAGAGMKSKKFQRFFKKPRMLPFIIVAIIVFVIAIVGIGSVIRKSTTNVTPTSASTTTGSNNTQQVNVPKPVATETLNKNFAFPLKDATGKVVSNIQYEIQSAEMDNQVIVKGEVATAITGKTFLILNLQITNNYDKAVQLNTRDYVRLIVNGNNDEKLAATIHNDPVDVEPISTTFTRIGFPISTNTTSLALEVGEIDGPKQTIPLTIKY
jgi:hypothetical protein